LGPNILAAIVRGEADHRVDFLPGARDYLGYVMPADYVMQGMIADTGDAFHLYKKHHTLTMITDWVLHPFQHLRRPPAMHMAKMHHLDPALARRQMCPLGINEPGMDCDTCPYRRVVFVAVTNGSATHLSGRDLFALNVTRAPAGFVDVNTKTGEIVSARRVPEATAWRDVPTPPF
jgi:hypothetical protein